MNQVQIEPLKLFADGLSLVYHEARNVYRIIEKGRLRAHGWEGLTDLAKSPAEAWKRLQGVRDRARARSSAREAAEDFRKRFGKTLEELKLLYENLNWENTGCGGKPWGHVTAVVSSLGQAIDNSDETKIRGACENPLRARHNHGTIRQKIRKLNGLVGASTDPWWQDRPGGEGARGRAR